MALQRWQGNSHTGCNKVVCYRHAPSAKALVLCVQPKLPSFRPWTDGRNNVVIMVGVFHWTLAHQADCSKQVPSVSANTARNVQPLPPKAPHLSSILLNDSKPTCGQLQGQTHLACSLAPWGHLLSLFRWAGSSKFPISSFLLLLNQGYLSKASLLWLLVHLVTFLSSGF